jgi:hypothetical protein
VQKLKGKTFVLGIGAQKSGTSWLYEYLRSRPEMYVSPIKELHYFDRIYRPDLCATLGRRFRVSLGRKLNRMAPDAQLVDRQDVIDLLDRLRMDYDKQAYLEFFRARAPESVRLLGEITPSYSLIDDKGI